MMRQNPSHHDFCEEIIASFFITRLDFPDSEKLEAPSLFGGFPQKRS